MATINGGLNGGTRAEQLQRFNNGHGNSAEATEPLQEPLQRVCQ